MATTSDIRDIMDMSPADGGRAPPKKKKKVVESQTRLTGISREVQALMGDSVPPVAIVETPKYKSKPSLTTKMFKPRHWEEVSFKHSARDDGLVLRHWKRAMPGTGITKLSAHRPSAGTAAASDTANANLSIDVDMDAEMTNGDDSEPKGTSHNSVVSANGPSTESRRHSKYQFEDEFSLDKWNIKVDIPSYSDEQYESHFKADGWTKGESDYLLRLARDFDLRWILIADRYDPSSLTSSGSGFATNGNVNEMGMEVARAYPDRSMEALKSRYYQIAAKDLELRIPVSNMTQAEFQLWEKMRTFDAKTEQLRKTMAEKLFERTKDEADEERTLLYELNRIEKHEEDFLRMRKDLYSRLESAPSLRRNERGEEQNVALYQTSSGLSMLLQNLFAKEKRHKRPAASNANGEQTSASSAAAAASGSGPGAVATPVDAKSRNASQHNRRDTIDSAVEDANATPHPQQHQKKGSIAASTAIVPVLKQLTPSEEAKYGVSHPTERLTSGVMFRHEKINRMTTAKSQVQTQKLMAALAELGIPLRLSMPTERVCREFERLVAEIQLLIESRKVMDKTLNEIKVLEEMRRQRLGLPKEGGEGGENGQGGSSSGKLNRSTKDGDREANAIEVGNSQPSTTGTAGSAEQNEKQHRKSSDAVGPHARGEHSTNKAQTTTTLPMTNQKPNSVGDEEEDDADEDEDGQSARRANRDNDEDEDEDEEDDEEEDDNDDDDQVNNSARPSHNVSDNDDDEEDEDEDQDQERRNIAVEGDDDDEEEGEEDDEDENKINISLTNGLDEDEEDEAEEEEQEQEQEDEDEEEEDNDDDEDEDEDEEEDEEEASPPPRPPPAPTTAPSRPTSSSSALTAGASAVRNHKRSASVVSESSRAGSNRSAMGRKKRR